jgi:excisionase family DNA binding protein
METRNVSSDIGFDSRSEDLLSTAEVAAICGVDQSTVWRWGRNGILPLYQVGKLFKFKRADLTKIIKTPVAAAS